MTTDEIREIARRLARETSDGITDTNVNDLISGGVDAFANEVGGFVAEEYIALTERFDTRTSWKIRLTIVGGSNALAATDIAITSTDRDNVTGSTVASDLQTAIQAAGASSATVAWTDYYFTIDSIDGTSITVEAPSDLTAYVDATSLLFGKTGTETGTTWTGDFPEDCTVEAALPTDCMTVEHVEWNGRRLLLRPTRGSISPQQTGTPMYYSIRGANIRIWPVPSTQDKFHIFYRMIPSLGTFDTNMPTEIPTRFHRAVSYWVAKEILLNNFEDELADRRQAEFIDWVIKYKIWRGRQTQSTSRSEPTYQPFKVIT